MNWRRSIPPAKLSLMSDYEQVRRRLAESPSTERDARCLGYWALGADRGLPHLLLTRPLREVLEMPFSTLASTPGIGPKKIRMLIELLDRAAALESSTPGLELARTGAAGFDPEAVSETDWAVWRDTIRRHRLTRESLGRLAPTLKALPTVVWERELGDYQDVSLSELRDLKCHGEKRVGAVLRVFHLIHHTLDSVPAEGPVAIQLQPRFLVPIESWISQMIGGKLEKGCDVRGQLVLPLLNQIELDAGDTVHQVAAGRLGVEGQVESVREQAARLGLTRARVYQLIEMACAVMRVRWPHGATWLTSLTTALKQQGVDEETIRQITALETILFVPATDSPKAGGAKTRTANPAGRGR